MKVGGKVIKVVENTEAKFYKFLSSLILRWQPYRFIFKIITRWCAILASEQGTDIWMELLLSIMLWICSKL